MNLVDRTFDSVAKAIKDAGVEKSKIDEIIMVGGMTRMPLVQKKVEEFFGKKGNQSVNPDEVVAVGAAVQGAVLSGDSSVQDITLLDVTPLSLGIEVNMGEMHVLIPRNTTIPSEKTEDMFTTAVDNQPAIDIKVLQGERPLAKDNKVLGTFRLDGLPPAPRGTPRFAITFKLDANGILSVKAKDLGTQKEQSITITASTHMDKSEIDKFVKEAEMNAEKDKKEAETLKVRNEADTLTYQIEKFLKDDGDKVSAEHKTSLEEKSKELKERLAKSEIDVEGVKAKTEELLKVFQEAGAKIYENAAKQAPQTENSDNTNKQNDEEEKPVEGEVVG